MISSLVAAGGVADPDGDGVEPEPDGAESGPIALAFLDLFFLLCLDLFFLFLGSMGTSTGGTAFSSNSFVAAPKPLGT